MFKLFYKWLVVILFITMASFKAHHPFYISYTEITQNIKTNKLQLSVRIFNDDLEKIIAKNYKKSIDLSSPKNKKEANDLVDDYVQKHLQIKVNDKAQPFSFIGYEIEEGSVWCYFETAGVSALKKLNVHTNILHDYIDQQINMVHIKLNSKDVTEKLDHPKTDVEFKF